MNVATVLAAIQVLMMEPNPDDALMADIAAEYRADRAAFNTKAKEMTQRHASGE